MKKRNSKGFTLIELMITVAIVAILAAVAIPSFQRYQLKSKQAEATANIGGIKTGIETFATNYDSYPPGIPLQGGGTNVKQQWVDVPCDQACSPTNVAACQMFSCFGWKPSGYVYYMYGVQAGDTAGVGNAISATANLDADANPGWFSYVTDADTDGAPDVATVNFANCPAAVASPTQLVDCFPGVF